MAGNTIGNLFQITTFGESHGVAIGGIIDGVPAGLEIKLTDIQSELDRRRPGQSNLTTKRSENDRVSILSGLLETEGIVYSTGAPIGFQISNLDANSKDYDHLKDVFRPSHADYTYEAKYGIRDVRGGGRSSARETACRVVGGAIARQLLQKISKTQISAYVERVQDICVSFKPDFIPQDIVDKTPVRCPDSEVAKRMIKRIEEVRDAGDTVGGAIVVVAKGVPSGWGEPVFDKLHADLAKALMSIPAVKGIELGSGFSGTLMRGSEHNDKFIMSNGEVSTKTNRSGGIQGGISNGENIVMRIAFKPVATLQTPQTTIDRNGLETVLEGKGRHDPCVLPRAVPIVEAMVALVLADHALRQRASSII